MLSDPESGGVVEEIKVEVPGPEEEIQEEENGLIVEHLLLEHEVDAGTTGEEDPEEIPRISEGILEEEEDDEIFEVEAILQERSKKGVKEYLVRWKGYGQDYDTWEPEDNLNCDEIIEEFKRAKERNRGKPGRKRKNPEEVTSPPKKSKAAAAVLKERKPREAGGKKRGRKPGVVSNKASRGRRKESSSESETEPATVVRCKTRFKKFVIEHAIKTEDDRDPDDDQSSDPLRKYFFKYDMDTGEFWVDKVKIEINEDIKFLTCTACNKPGPIWGKEVKDQVAYHAKRLAESMRHHVIGQHLGGFTCTVCEKNELFYHTKTLRCYQLHLGRIHRRRLNMELYEDDEEMEEAPPIEEGEEDDEAGGTGDIVKAQEVVDMPAVEAAQENGS